MGDSRTVSITKCDDQSCYLPFRSSLLLTLSAGFILSPYPKIHLPRFSIPPPKNALKLRPPLMLTHLNIRLKPIDDGYQKISYVCYCLSLQKDLFERTCSVCGLYLSTNESAGNHTKIMPKKESHRYPKLNTLFVVTRNY
ncbi:uncharacterized protein LOC117170338 [Belonocnema kinseyi]|uniref:uncharacterized protein LOC117170338 n=1 Tax=Belonocnema kinseyi TaxID=2817044 RepID=UPI00143D7350|nr:uncharacterized protein LOC117170338 [Belonocnema kinseyi]